MLADTTLIHYVAAALPILAVLILMAVFRWGGHRAGPAGWLTGMIVAALLFGLNAEVLIVSQAKGVLLSLFVLMVLWPALYVHNIIARARGIEALVGALGRLIADRDILLITVAWAFSGMLEGFTGFGVPIAVGAPMLVALGVAPVLAVAAVAIGHAWSITFGGLGVIYQTLIAVTRADPVALVPPAALMLGLACLGCGLSVAMILGQRHHWPRVVIMALVMAFVQYALASQGITSLASLGAGASGILAGIVLSRRPALTMSAPHTPPSQTPPSPDDQPSNSRTLVATLVIYGGLVLLMISITLIRPLQSALAGIMWRPDFPEVTTLSGFVTPAGPGQVFRPLVHPGASLLLVGTLGLIGLRATGLLQKGDSRAVVRATWHSAGPASVGVFAMVGLSALMDHCGMTQLLAQGLSNALGLAFPLVSPLVGVLGAFATGSNNNSNVLFAPLQQNVALLLGISPLLLLAAQTAGGAIGSMISPVKILVGAGAVGLRGQDGEVLRRTVGYALAISLSLGALVFILSRTVP